MNKQKLLYADSSFEKLRDFENALAAVDEIETLVINDTVSRTNALKSDQIDAMNRCDLKTAHLLKKAGMEQQVFTLYASNAAFAGGMDAAVLFKEYANKAGVKMEVVQEPADGYWSNVWMKKPWSMSYLSGRPTEDMIFSLQSARGAAWNDTFWDNDRFNKLLIGARSELDKSKRRQMYAEMQKLIRDDGGIIRPFFADNVDAGGKKLKFEKLSGQSSLDGFRCSERWWFES